MPNINLNISENLSVTLSPMFTGVKNCAKYTVMNNKIWILIPKNGCSTIAFCSEIHNNNADKIQYEMDSTGSHAVDWYRLNRNGTIIPNRLIIDYDLPRIAFYRDPVDRFCSLINYAYSNFYGKQLTTCDYPALFTDDLEQTLKNFVIYCTIANMFTNVDTSDQHAVSQSKYLEYCGTKNLTLYHLKDLKKVFEKEGIVHYSINESSKRIVNKDNIPEYILEQVKYIYRDDYNLEKLIQNVDA
jgi:hypothetical protein